MTEELKNEARLLYNRLSRDINDNSKKISTKKCNDYIEDLESLKEDLDNEGYEWIENLSDIEYFEEPNLFIPEASKEEIYDALEEAIAQLERILMKLGIDVTEKRFFQTQPINNPVTINFSPTMNQHVNTSANINFDIQVRNLVEEFNEEYKKFIPNKTKLNKIIDKLKAIGPYAAPVVEKLIEKMAGALF